MDLQSIQRADRVSGPFRAPRYGRPDPMREPDAYMHWLVTEREMPRAPGELVKLPWVEDVYTIGPVAVPAERKWFVVVTEPAKERSVCDDLRRDGIEPFSPLVRSLAFKRGRKRILTRPLLPRYVFAGLPQPLPSFRAILDVDGAREILGHSGSPVELPRAIIDDLRRRDADGEWDDTQRQAKGYGREPAARQWKWVKADALVCVLSGPFKHFHGIIEAVDAGRKLAKVGIAIFGRVSPVELQFDQIEEV